ncbi:MAG TPA: zinc-binding dehydrogenase [Chloroflexia bacterium]|nr:zinc-binding dehydrogenase [Chloroflexia bacterium]
MSLEYTQALVVTGPDQFGLQQVKLRPLGSEEIRVRTHYTSISAGTERMLLRGQLVEMAGLPFPCIPGYETVGEVIEVGPEVPEPQFWLGRMAFIGGSYGYEGVTSAWGGQAQYVSADYRKAFLLPEKLDPALAVAIAPAATAWHGIELAAPAPGERVLVLGQGPIGQFAAQAASLRGADVAVADLSAERLARCVAGEPKIDLSRETLKERLNGPLDLLIDATGKMEALATHLMSVRPRGKVLLLGFYQRIDLPFAIPFLKELSFQPSREWAAEDIPAVGQALAEGHLQAEHMFTARFQISRIHEAYAAALDPAAGLKVLIEWP